MEQFLGKKYQLKSSEKFDEYLEFIGISGAIKNAAASLTPVIQLTRNGDGSYTFTVETPIQNKSVTFKPNEEFDNERPDGAKVKSRVTINGNKLTYTDVESNGRKSTHERVFTADTLTVTTTAEGWPGKCVRTFAAIN